MRALVRAGYLGDRVVHMESYYGYDLGDARYARAFLGDPDHWVQSSPAGSPRTSSVTASPGSPSSSRASIPGWWPLGFASPGLRRAGGEDLVDELRVVVADEADRTAYFTFSSGMRPVLYQFRIFGSANGLVLDEQRSILPELRGAPFKSHLERFAPPVVFAKQYGGTRASKRAPFLATSSTSSGKSR